jgi:hypothetical protein
LTIAWRPASAGQNPELLQEVLSGAEDAELSELGELSDQSVTMMGVVTPRLLINMDAGAKTQIFL